MEETYRQHYHDAEDTLWWSVGRRDIVERLLESDGVSRKSAIVDVGCAGGVLLEHLAKHGFENLYGADLSPEAVEVAHQRGLKNVRQMDAAKLEFEDDQFDVVIASDVLEHIGDDESALRDWRRVLKPDGTLYVFVPAFMFLWSGHDEVNQHMRRYAKPQLRTVLERAGFSVSRLSFWNTTLFFPVAAVRVAHRLARFGSDAPHDMSKPRPVVNRVLSGLLELENRALEKGIDAPVGVSVFAVAKPR